MKNEALVQARERLGLTQGQLGAKVGLTRTMITQIENGTRVPSLEKAMRLSRETGLAVEKFLPPQGTPGAPIDASAHCG